MKRVLFFIATVLISLNCFSQIETSVFDVRIGCYEGQVINTLKEKGLTVIHDDNLNCYRAFYSDNKEIVVDDNYWDMIVLKFENDRLQSITFTDINCKNPELYYSRLGNQLNKMYKDYLKKDDLFGQMVFMDKTNKGVALKAIRDNSTSVSVNLVYFQM